MNVVARRQRTAPLNFAAVVRPPAKASAGGTPAESAAISGPADAKIAERFIELEAVARSARTLDELRFALVNSWRRLLAFDQALLAEPGVGDEWRVTLGSGVTSVDRNAPSVHAANGWLRERGEALSEAVILDLDHNLDGIAGTAEAILPSHGLWLPIKQRDERACAGLILLRRTPWQLPEQALLMPLADAFAYSWRSLGPREGIATRARGVLSRRWLAAVGAIAVVAAAFIPVPMSALAPAEVVAALPGVVTAPADGVIADISVPPGAWVDKDQLIARLVDVKARNDVEIAARNVAVAAARYSRTVQSATSNMKDAHEIATTKAEWDLARAEMAFASDLLARTEIRAERAGVLIYSAKSDWVGKPVATGERLMEIGDPAHIEVRIDMPVSDAIVLDGNNRIALFLDGDPLNAIGGQVTRTSYRPTTTPDQQLVYRILARLDSGSGPQIGLRGTARVSGRSVGLGFYLFRRPISALRQRLGL